MGTFEISLKQSKNGGIKCRWTGAGFSAVQPVLVHQFGESPNTFILLSESCWDKRL